MFGGCDEIPALDTVPPGLAAALRRACRRPGSRSCRTRARLPPLGADGFVYFNLDVDHDVDSGTPDIRGFFRVPVIEEPVPYCTATPSVFGCLAALTTTDPLAQPVSGAADYSVVATGLEGQRNGILFFGFTGGTMLPFRGSGTLCVQPPLKRSLVQNSGGTAGACDGSIQVLLNDGASVWDPGPGTNVWIQAWYRLEALSNGLAVEYE